MKRLATLLSVLLLAMGWTMINADEAHAQEILNAWNATGNSGTTPDPWAATTTSSDMQTAYLTRGSGIDASGLSNGYAASGWYPATNLAEAIAQNKYIEFTLRSSDLVGNIVLDELNARMRRTGTGPTHYHWHASVDGGSFTAIGTARQITTSWSGSSVTVQDPLDLSDVAASPEITFRIYLWGENTNFASGGTFAFGTGSGDDLSITGSVSTGILVPTVTFGSASGSVNEGGTFDIPVTLSNFDSQEVSVNVALTSEGDDEFNPVYTTRELTFDANGTQNVSLVLTDDDGVWTGDRSVTFELQGVSGGPDAIIGTPGTFTLTILETTPPPPLSIAAARAEGVGANVTVEGVVSRAMGDFAYFQDDTAGLSIRQTSGAFHDAVDTGDITTGTRIRITGTISAYMGLLQINDGDLDSFDILEQDVMITSQLVTLDQLVGDSHQAQLVTVHGLTVTETGTWSSGTSYDATDGTATVELRVPNASDNTIAGESIPSDEFTFNGIIGHFNAPQLMTILATDVTVETEVVLSIGEANEGPGWRMLASPLAGSTVLNLANANLVRGLSDEYPTGDVNVFLGYTGDNSEEDDGSGFIPATSLTNALVPGKGFIWYLFDANYNPHEEEEGTLNGFSQSYELPFQLTYTGSPVVENHQVTFLHSERAETDDGFYLIGNPYASDYDVAGISADVGILGTTFSYWDPTEGYIELNDVEFSGIAPVGAGFFAEFTTVPETDVAFTFTEAPDVEDRSDAEVLFARFQLSGELVVPYEGTDFTFDILDRNARAVFTDLATDGRDRYDATKLNPMTEYWAGIAMIGVEGDEMVRRAAESRPMPLQATTLPMALTTHTAADLEAGGTFTIELVTNALGAGWEISLRDLETGQTVNMLTDSYSFTLPVQPAIDADPRFEITFTPPTVSGDDGGDGLVFGLEALWPNPTHGTTQVAFTLPQAQDITLDVFDVLGRRVMQIANDEYGSGRHVLPMNTGALASGVYVVRLTAGSQTAVQRVTVAR